MKEDDLILCCPKCEETFRIPMELVKLEASHAKFRKVVEVAQQMHDKSGPFYDRWVAAMAARGKQMTCSDCISFHRRPRLMPDNYCTVKLKAVNPAWFACNHVTFYEG